MWVLLILLTFNRALPYMISQPFATQEQCDTARDDITRNIALDAQQHPLYSYAVISATCEENNAGH